MKVMCKLIALSLLLILKSAQAGINTVETKLIGSRQPIYRFIYLHGMDSFYPSKQEMHNRKILNQIGQQLKIQFVAIRGNTRCWNNTKLLCWKQDTRKDVKNTYQFIINKLAKTGYHHKINGIIGFSNGGFLVNKIVQACIATDIPWFLSLGSAGNYDLHVKHPRSCGKLTTLIGKHDIATYKYTINYVNWMKNNGYNVLLVTFDGGHETPFLSTKQAIQSLIRKRSRAK